MPIPRCVACEKPLTFPQIDLDRGGAVMLPCPLCKRVMCDHLLAERGDGMCPDGHQQPPRPPVPTQEQKITARDTVEGVTHEATLKVSGVGDPCEDSNRAEFPNLGDLKHAVAQALADEVDKALKARNFELVWVLHGALIWEVHGGARQDPLRAIQHLIKQRDDYKQKAQAVDTLLDEAAHRIRVHGCAHQNKCDHCADAMAVKVLALKDDPTITMAASCGGSGWVSASGDWKKDGGYKCPGCPDCPAKKD